jgi:hypothetical protein
MDSLGGRQMFSVCMCFLCEIKSLCTIIDMEFKFELNHQEFLRINNNVSRDNRQNYSMSCNPFLSIFGNCSKVVSVYRHFFEKPLLCSLFICNYVFILISSCTSQY